MGVFIMIGYGLERSLRSVGDMMNRKKGALFVLMGAASFGFTPIFVKLGFEEGYTLGEINIIQMLIAFIVLWAITFIFKAKRLNLGKKSVWRIMVTGSFVGLTSIFYYGAIGYLSASLAIILLFQFVWIGIVFESILYRKKPSLLTILSVILTLCGVVLASGIIHSESLEIPFLGFAFGMLSAISYSGFIFFSGKVAVDVSPYLRSSLMVSGSLVLVVLVFMNDLPGFPLEEIDFWALGTGVAFFGAIIPPLFFAIGAPGLSDGLANILSSIELPVALISASLILSETISWVQWIGVLLIISAIFMNNIRTAKKE